MSQLCCLNFSSFSHASATVLCFSSSLGKLFGPSKLPTICNELSIGVGVRPHVSSFTFYQPGNFPWANHLTSWNFQFLFNLQIFSSAFIEIYHTIHLIQYYHYIHGVVQSPPQSILHFHSPLKKWCAYQESLSLSSASFSVLRNH